MACQAKVPIVHRFSITWTSLRQREVTTDPEAIAKWTWQDFTDAAKALTKMDGDDVKQSGFMVPKAGCIDVERLGKLSWH